MQTCRTALAAGQVGGLPEGVSFLEPGQRVEFRLVPPHLPGKAHQAKVVRVIESARAAAHYIVSGRWNASPPSAAVGPGVVINGKGQGFDRGD
jgi:hypothetical protein